VREKGEKRREGQGGRECKQRKEKAASNDETIGNLIKGEGKKKARKGEKNRIKKDISKGTKVKDESTWTEKSEIKRGGPHKRVQGGGPD